MWNRFRKLKKKEALSADCLQGKRSRRVTTFYLFSIFGSNLKPAAVKELKDGSSTIFCPLVVYSKAF